VNYIAITLWSLVCLLVIWLMILPMADSYTMDLLWQWQGNPLICIWDNKYNNLFEQAVNEWNDALYTLGPDWVLSYKIVDGDTSNEIIKYCQINLVLIEYSITKDIEYNGIIGRTSYHTNSFRIFIVVYEERDSEYYSNFDDAIVKTTKHELGHGFGLNHWMPESPGEGLKPWPASLMWQYSDKNYNGTVDQYSLDALVCWYGEDGWEKPNDRDCKFIEQIKIPKIVYDKKIFTVKI